MSHLFQIVYDAMFASPEAFRQQHVRFPISRKKNEKQDQLENRIFISGGILSTRLRVLNGAIGQQLKTGRAVVVLQPANKPLYDFTSEFPQITLNACDGTYDPFCGQSLEDSSRMLSDAAVACGFSVAEAADLIPSITDEIAHLFQHDGEVHLGDFVHTTSRDLGNAAFVQNADQLAESHEDKEINARLDWLRFAAGRHCRFNHAGISLYSTVKPQTVTVIRLPQSSTCWMSFALYELTNLQNSSHFDIMPVFLGMNISETCRATVEGLPGGRCFCYQDLPSLGWIWSTSIAASSTGCLLKHIGISAQTVSNYFGKDKVAKVTNTTSFSKSNCDSGGLMGIFGSKTLSDSSGCTVSYEWEPAIPDNAIRQLDDDEGIFIYQNFNKPYRINV